VTRWKNILLATAMYQLCRRRPLTARRLLRSGVGRQLPIGYHLDPDFLPRYEPWDQRLCVVPDGDLFTAIRSGRVSMVTDRIDTFTPTGIRLESGDHLDADVVVSATGLRLVAFGGIELAVDGRRVDPGQAYVYRGCMLGEIPNLAMCLGYTNASWTLRADLTSRTVCRLLNKMDRHGFTRVVPRLPEAARQPHPLLDLSSGYVTRSADDLPKQGSRPPWRLRQNYILDLLTARLAKADRHLTFSRLSRFEASAG
jgi:cation diffusion facilitator CzcD-associated flavoprotein CzcO